MGSLEIRKAAIAEAAVERCTKERREKLGMSTLQDRVTGVYQAAWTGWIGNFSSTEQCEICGWAGADATTRST